MVNVTVVGKKDVIKYLARITVAIIFIFILAKFFYGIKNNNINFDFKEENIALISCLEETIPQVKQNEVNEEKESEPVKKILTKELGVMSAITKNDVSIEKLANEQSSITINEVENSEPKDNVLENSQSSQMQDENIANIRRYRKGRNKYKNRSYKN